MCLKNLWPREKPGEKHWPSEKSKQTGPKKMTMRKA